MLQDGGRDAGWVTTRVGRTGYRAETTARSHAFVADEPLDVGGTDTGPTPYEQLLGALAGCTAMTVRMYADRKGWPLEGIMVRLRPVRSHAADCADCETKAVSVGQLEREVEFTGVLTDEQRARLLWIADRCPIKQSLERGLHIAPAVSAVPAAPVTP